MTGENRRQRDRNARKFLAALMLMSVFFLGGVLWLYNNVPGEWQHGGIWVVGVSAAYSAQSLVSRLDRRKV